MSKTDDIVRLVESRLRLGDYVREGVPSEDRLALDAGVSRMTARKVLLKLEKKGLVTRSDTGRRTFSTQVVKAAPTQVAVLRQTWMDRVSSAALRELRQVADSFGLQLRTFEFLHWDDPVITQTLALAECDAESPGDGIAGVLIAPPAEPMPDVLLERLARGPTRVAVETLDLSHRGIPSIKTVHPDALPTVLNHLASLGPGPIDCFNTQPEEPPTMATIDGWAAWCQDAGRSGKRFSRPVVSYSDPMAHARAVGHEYFDQCGDELPRAIFCATEAAAVGLIRCAADRGVTVGRDVAIAALKDSGHAEFLVPSLTCVRRPSRVPMYRKCLEWMTGRHEWLGSCQLIPDQCELFVGESTMHHGSTMPATL